MYPQQDTEHIHTVATYLPTSAPVCQPSHGSRPATRGSIKSSPLPSPCQHMDSTTQHNSKTSLTFSPTSRNIRYKSRAVLGNKDGSNFLENDNMQPPKMLPLPRCLQSSMPDSLCGGAIHHCCEWSSPSCLSVLFKN